MHACRKKVWRQKACTNPFRLPSGARSSDHITPRLTVRKEITAITRKTKNKIWAIPLADPAMPLNPSKAATIAMIKNVIALLCIC